MNDIEKLREFFNSNKETVLDWVNIIVESESINLEQYILSGVMDVIYQVPCIINKEQRVELLDKLQNSNNSKKVKK